ncbi:MAG: hypothetical protein KAU90_09185, partial [Sulfurovaceae bacterium]|nr:hypothetical protein [Sulfurovaceae bacterium]
MRFFSLLIIIIFLITGCSVSPHKNQIESTQSSVKFVQPTPVITIIPEKKIYNEIPAPTITTIPEKEKKIYN